MFALILLTSYDDSFISGSERLLQYYKVLLCEVIFQDVTYGTFHSTAGK